MIRTALIALAVLALVAFAAGNWPAFTAPAALTLGFANFTAPLGVLMLAALGLVVLLFLAVVAVGHAHRLGDARRHARELAAARALADEAEASRLTALRTTLDQEVARLEQRIEVLHAETRVQVREGVDSLAAMIGEMDDRLMRVRAARVADVPVVDDIDETASLALQESHPVGPPH